MNPANRNWDPTSARSWADTLGLLEIPLFGKTHSEEWDGESNVLLDGQRASFILFTTESEDATADHNIESWTWSSNLSHAIIINKRSDTLILKRWDEFEPIHADLPTDKRQAFNLLNKIKRSTRPKYSPVITYILDAFRQIRAMMPPKADIDTITIFNALLLSAEKVKHANEIDEWQNSRNLSEAFGVLSPDENDFAGIAFLKNTEILTKPIGWLLRLFAEPEPELQLILEPHLLLRHAAGALYQEAHLLIEREHEQLHFPGEARSKKSKNIKRDVRFTPATLARTITQQAFNSNLDLIDKECLEILDPACGSGIFLVEALRELHLRGYNGKVILKGFDISDVSHAMAKFCLEIAKRDLLSTQMEVKIEITKADALTMDWDHPDLILMNPPFISLENMDSDQKKLVVDTLGELKKGRVDSAMAFVWKAVKSIISGAVIGSVLPSSLLGTESGSKWRSAIAGKSEVCFIGRFQGYGFFQYSMVEPSFIILKQTSDHPPPDKLVKVLIADQGHEDQAMRGLRVFQSIGRTKKKGAWEIYNSPLDKLGPQSWLPMKSQYQDIIRELENRDLSTVSELFNVHQGSKTGKDDVFIVSSDEFNNLPPDERIFFRPIASSRSIKDGRIFAQTYVFFPFDTDGLTIVSEESLIQKVPEFFESKLQPNKSLLIKRRGVDAAKWWVLTRSREWQHAEESKLATKSYGKCGSFAFDNKGNFVVLQGYAWLWKEKFSSHDSLFTDSVYPWAYLALLNNQVFETLLACYCPRTHGGQYYLDRKYVSKIPIPDLTDEYQIPSRLVKQLSEIGTRIHEGNSYDTRALFNVAGSVYKSLDLFSAVSFGT